MSTPLVDTVTTESLLSSPVEFASLDLMTIQLDDLVYLEKDMVFTAVRYSCFLKPFQFQGDGLGLYDLHSEVCGLFSRSLVYLFG